MNLDPLTPSDSPPPKDAHPLLTPAFLLSLNSADPLVSSSVLSIDTRKSRESPDENSTEKQFSDLSKLGKREKSSSGSSIYMSFSNLSCKGQTALHGEDDPITRSILDDISDHDLLYSSTTRKPSTIHHIGISLLTDIDFPKALDSETTPDSHKLGSLCTQFSAELKNTKDELTKLYRENRDLRGRIRSQEDHIRVLNEKYCEQTTCLRRELDELRRVVVGRKSGDFGEETDAGPNWCKESEPCCAIF